MDSYTDEGPTDAQLIDWAEHNAHADGLVEEVSADSWRVAWDAARRETVALELAGDADAYRERGEDPVDRASCPHGGLLLTEDPDVYDCAEGCGDDERRGDDEPEGWHTRIAEALRAEWPSTMCDGFEDAVAGVVMEVVGDKLRALDEIHNQLREAGYPCG